MVVEGSVKGEWTGVTYREKLGIFQTNQDTFMENEQEKEPFDQARELWNEDNATNREA